MTQILTILTPTELGLAFLIASLSGFVKGIVGFAMPMIMVSGLGMFLSPELALAGLIFPTLVANGWQALRDGWRSAWGSVRKFGLFLGVGLIFLFASAQLFRILPTSALVLLIGIPVTFFALIQLLGVRLTLRAPSRRIEAAIGAVAGFIGGLSGIWGPPTVAYLTALDTPKAEQMRVQGAIYGLGAVALLGAHISSGIVTTQTVPFSILLIGPAVLGMWLGGLVQDRIDQVLFRRATLAVLLLAGLNLVRRGVMG